MLVLILALENIRVRGGKQHSLVIYRLSVTTKEAEEEVLWGWTENKEGKEKRAVRREAGKKTETRGPSASRSRARMARRVHAGPRAQRSGPAARGLLLPDEQRRLEGADVLLALPVLPLRVVVPELRELAADAGVRDARVHQRARAPPARAVRAPAVCGPERRAREGPPAVRQTSVSTSI